MSIPNICDLGFNFTYDGLRLLLAGVAAFAWLMSYIFSPRYMSHDENKKRFYIFTTITFLATEGVFFSADLFTLFTFFEIMSLASYVWVVQEEKKKAIEAGDTYLAFAVIGGLVLLMGIVLLYTNVGTVNIADLKEACATGGKYGKGRLYAAAFCMFFGFAAKAGAFPTHVWLPKAHPVAPAPASALLSGVLTKTGIFGIMVVSFSIMTNDHVWGCFILGTGLVTMALGAVLALFSINIKRTLACSSVSQIGFILTGIGSAVLLGEEAELAKYGTVLHMVNHSLVKMTVFLVAGVVYQNLHSLDLNEIRGFGKKKPLIMISFALGGLSLAGVPSFLGYMSKTAIHEALVEACEEFAPWMSVCFEWVFLISGGLTLCYMTKLFICVFVENNKDKKKQEEFLAKTDYMDLTQKAAVFIPAALVLGLGISTCAAKNFEFLAFHMMKGGLISITIGTLLYIFLVRKVFIKNDYIDLWPAKLDIENLIYRPLLLVVLPNLVGFFMRLMDRLVDNIIWVLRKTIYSDKPLSDERIEGNAFTHRVGHLLDVISAKRKGEKEVTYNYEHKLAILLMIEDENSGITRRSLSYGLLMACAGMFVILGFILYLVFLR